MVIQMQGMIVITILWCFVCVWLWFLEGEIEKLIHLCLIAVGSMAVFVFVWTIYPLLIYSAVEEYVGKMVSTTTETSVTKHTGTTVERITGTTVDFLIEYDSKTLNYVLPASDIRVDGLKKIRTVKILKTNNLYGATKSLIVTDTNGAVLFK